MAGFGFRYENRSYGFRNEQDSDLYGLPKLQQFDLRELIALDRKDMDLGVNLDAGDSSTTSISDAIKDAVAKIGAPALSAVGYIAGSIDKPFAAMRGVLAGDPSALLLAIPFSESFLRKPIDNLLQGLGINAKVPEKHITGREVLEAWGAPKNKEGFKPFRDPADALFDVAGLALEFLIVPPFLPRIGALTAKGQQAYRIGKNFRPLLEAEREITTIAPKVAELPEALNLLRTSGEKALPAILERAGASKQSINVLQDMLQSASPGAKEMLQRTVQTAAETGDLAHLSRHLETLPEMLRFHGAVEGQKFLPAVSPTGRIQELQEGTRGLVLEPVWYWKNLLPQVDVPMQWAAKPLEKAAQLLPFRVVSSLFHWASKDNISKFGQRAANQFVEHSRQMLGSAANLHLQHSQFLGALSDQWAKYAQMATLGNNRTGQATWENMLVWLAEHSRKYHGTQGEKALEIAKQVFAGQEVTPEMHKFVQDVVSVIESSPVEILRTMDNTLGKLGVPTRHTASIWGAEYWPRYTPETPVAQSGIGRFGEAALGSVGKLKYRRTFLDVPGGQLTINLASHDPLLQKFSTKTATIPVGELLGKNSAGRQFIYGDYVRFGETEGRISRIANINGKQSAIIRLPGTNEEIVANLDELIKVNAPADPTKQVFLESLHPATQKQLAAKWLANEGVQVDKKANLVQVLSQYLHTRYAEPYAVGPDGAPNAILQAVWLGTKEGSAKDLAKQLREIVPDLSVRRAKELARMAFSGGVANRTVRFLLNRQSKGPLYSQDILGDLFKRITIESDLIAATSNVHEMIARAAFIPADATAARGVPLREFWESVRIPVPGSKKGASAPLTQQGLESLLDNLLGRQEIAQQLNSIPRGQWADLVRVPEGLQNTINRFLRVVTPETEEYHWFTDAVRRFTRTWASWATVPRLAFHVRNHTSDMLRGIIADAPYSIPQYFEAWNQVRNAAFKGEWQTLPYFEEMSKLNVLRSSARIGDLELAPVVGQGFSLTKATKAPPSFWDLFTPLKQTKEWGTKLFTTEHPLVKAGQSLFETTEAMGRAPVYIAARNAGMTPAQAKEFIDLVMYNYGRMSGFEQKYVRPSLMFYGWLRQNMGYMLPRVMLDYQSGASHLLRGVGRIWSQGGQELPMWMQETLAVPIGKNDKGETVVVKSLGLPLEDISLISWNAGEVLSKIYSRMHPALKAAYQITTGEDPFTGIPLKVSESVYERLGFPRKAVDTGIMAAKAAVGGEERPIIRPFLKLAETFDPHAAFLRQFSNIFSSSEPLWIRALDAASGIRTGAYDVEKQRLNDVLDYMHSKIVRMPGVYQYKTVYAAPEATSAEKRLVEVYREIERLRKELKKQRPPTSSPYVQL